MTIKIIQRSLDESKSFDRIFAGLGPNILSEHQLSGLIPARILPTVINYAQCMQASFWIAQIDGQVLGRIGANMLPSHPGQGAIGFFLVDRKHAKAQQISVLLLETACQWLKKQKIRTVFGPVDLHTWFPYRYPVTKDSNNPKFDWEPGDPDNYLELWQLAGFKPIENYISQGKGDLAHLHQHTQSSYQKMLNQGYQFELKDMDSLTSYDYQKVHALSMNGFKENPLFEPIPLELFTKLYKNSGKVPKESLIMLGKTDKGEIVNFVFGFVDQDYVVLKSTATDPAHRSKGLTNASCHLFVENYLKIGMTKHITALIRTGNVSEVFNRQGMHLWTNSYVLLQKDL